MPLDTTFLSPIGFHADFVFSDSSHRRKVDRGVSITISACNRLVGVKGGDYAERTAEQKLGSCNIVPERTVHLKDILRGHIGRLAW